jgi:hypothetical protein
MKFKPGDKVSFLNEKRDGIVKKVLNNKMVIVEIEDGFEIPVIETDLVCANQFEENVTENHSTASNNNIDAEERFPERFALNESVSGEQKLKSGMYLVFIPEDAEQFLDGDFAVYLLNHTGFDVLFTYSMLENGKYLCTDFNRIDEESALLISNIDKSGFEKWSHLKFQMISFKKGQESPDSPQTCELRIKPVRFYKEDNYSFLPAIGEKCFLVAFAEKEKAEPETCLTTTRMNDIVGQGQAGSNTEWKNEKITKPSGIKIVGYINELHKPAPFPEKHITESGIAEVDLHIEELADDLSKVKNHDILSIQLNYFSKMLDSAMANKLRKIIFIHGVGNGLLKQEIISKLKNNYPDLVYADASLLRYGKGATEIILQD